MLIILWGNLTRPTFSLSQLASILVGSKPPFLRLELQIQHPVMYPAQQEQVRKYSFPVIAIKFKSVQKPEEYEYDEK